MWACVLLTPVTLLAAAVAFVSKAPKAPVIAARAPQTVSSPGRVTATLEIDSWLKTKPSPLPGGTIVAWDGATTVPVPAPEKGSNVPAPAFRPEIDTFTLKADSGVYRVSVEVAVTSSGATALGGPSVEAANFSPPVDTLNGNGPWPGYLAGTTVSGPVKQAVDSWAAAYTSGKPSELALDVGDPDTSDHYRPLSGVSSVKATVDYVASVPADGPTARILEVSLAIVWDHEKVPNGYSASDLTGPQTTMDLLVERATSAAPSVVAWGPPGSGPTLRPYQNGKSK